MERRLSRYSVCACVVGATFAFASDKLIQKILIMLRPLGWLAEAAGQEGG